MFRNAILSFLMAFSSNALAGATASSAFKVSSLIVGINSKNITLHQESSTYHNPAKCTKADRYIFVLEDNYLSNRVMAVLTTAAATKQNMKLSIYDDRCINLNNGETYPQAVSVHLN